MVGFRLFHFGLSDAEQLALGDFEVETAQKQKLSRHCSESTIRGVAAWGFDPGGAFEAKFERAPGQIKAGEIKQQEAVRQSRENITRIGPTGSFRVV